MTHIYLFLSKTSRLDYKQYSILKKGMIQLGNLLYINFH